MAKPQWLIEQENKRRPIGSKAVLNGKEVFWSGERYLWQSEKSYKELQETSEFRFGHIGLSRLGAGLVSAIPDPLKDGLKQGIGLAASSYMQAMDYKRQRYREVYGDDVADRYEASEAKTAKGLQAINQNVLQPIDQGLEKFSKATNTSRILTDELLLNLTTSGGSAVARHGGALAIRQGTKAIEAVKDLDNVIDTARYRDLTRGIALSKQRSPSLYSGLPLPEELSDLTSKVKSKVKALPKVNVKAKVSPEVKAAQDLLDGIHLDDVPSNRTKVNGNGHVKKKNNPSTKVSEKVALKSEVLIKFDERLTQIDEQIEAIRKQGVKPKSPESAKISKLNEFKDKIKRAKASVVQTRYTDDVYDGFSDNINSADNLVAVHENLFSRLKASMSIKGYNTPVHHNSMLQANAIPHFKMELPKAVNVQDTLINKYQRHLGDDIPNFTTYYTKQAHDFAHLGDTKDRRIRELLSKIDTSGTAEEIADQIETVSRQTDIQALNAKFSKGNINRGHELYDSLSPSQQNKLPKDFNVMDTLSPGWDQFSIMIKNLHPEIKTKLNRKSKVLLDLNSINIE